MGIGVGATLFQRRNDGIDTGTPYSSFSPGLGFELGLGGVIRRIQKNFTISGGIEYVRTHHDTSYPSTYDYPEIVLNSATLQLFQFELRAIWDQWKIKPYLGIAPGLVHMDLPNHELVLAPAPQDTYTTIDAWKSGISAGASLGALYEVLPTMMVDCSIGSRWDLFGRTNEMVLGNDYEAGLSFAMTLGLEWWP